MKNGELDRDGILMLTSYMPEDFFDGLGSYLGGKNMDAAITFIGKKIWRMAEKMGNPDNEHTFDIFEEYLFDKILLWANEELTTLPEVKETYLKLCEMRQRLVEGTLMEKYGYSESRAKEMAETVCRLDKMRPDWETFDEDSLFFWDDDFSIFFQDCFVKGIQSLTNVGNALGYDYASICEIFTDAGYPVPLRLVGTKETSDIKNEAAMERVRDEIDKAFSDFN